MVLPSRPLVLPSRPLVWPSASMRCANSGDADHKAAHLDGRLPVDHQPGWTRAEVDLEIPAACVLLMRAPIPDRRIGHMTDASCSASRSAQQGPALTLLRRDRYKLTRERVENDDGHNVTSWRTHQRVLSAGAQPVLPYPA